MNGPPAKPISGVPPSSAVSCPIACATKPTSPGSRSRSLATSSGSRNGLAVTGPTPGWMSMSTPAARSGTTMSLNKMAASTPYRRTGCSVISVMMSGVKQASSIAIPALAALYSGSARPAWRIYHTGTLATGWRRQALMNAESEVGLFTPGIVS